MLSRIVHLSLALSVASLALPRAGDRWICRYTGEAMSPCPCPASSDEPAGPALSGSGCCELQKAGVEGEPVVATAAAATPPRIDAPLVLLSLFHGALSGATRSSQVPARQQGPPTEPRFITHRSLLI